MAMQRCERGHAFDSKKYTSCPYCGISNFDPGPTRAHTQTVEKASYGEEALTRPRVAGEKGGQRDEDLRTVGLMVKEKGIDPVVGWLVCIEGAEKGRDYRIRSGRNVVGRARHMDICIAGDDAISRENHAALAYDPKKNAFTLLPGEGRELVYLNQEALYQPASLKQHDIIEMGQTKLMFIPFCGDTFQW